MPFRNFYRRVGARHPGAYSNLTFALGVLACMIIAVTVSVSASNRATERSIQRERATQEQARQAVCEVVHSMEDVYAEPTTPTGVKAQAAWRGLRTRFGC